MLRGEYNVENMLCAVTVLVSQSISTESIKKTLENFEPLDGRMEEVENNRGLEIYIDYAHTEASLQSVLRTLHVYKKQDAQLIVLFGATGDRDRDKRPKMGKVVDRVR
jgi:UDP-N-acetylmuramoyl-L-alanyl-D-glutamate--2,6-diaminopimelate ligase